MAATTREHQPLRGRHNIAIRVDRALRKDKVGRPFDVQPTDESCSWECSDGRTARQTVLDDIYIVRTHVPRDRLSSQEAVRSDKGVGQIERAFRSYKRQWTSRFVWFPTVPKVGCKRLSSCGCWPTPRSGPCAVRRHRCSSMMRSRVSPRTLPLRGPARRSKEARGQGCAQAHEGSLASAQFPHAPGWSGHLESPTGSASGQGPGGCRRAQ